MRVIIIFLIGILSVCFSGVWVAYDFKTTYEVYGFKANADKGALTVGYVTSLESDDKLSFGVSYTIKGATSDETNGEAKMLDIFSRYNVPINEDLSFWGSLGYSHPVGDIDDLDGGLSYGFGFLHTKGIGFYYIISNLVSPADYYFYDYDIDFDVARLGLSYNF